MKRTYIIEVDCANCADKMERAAEKTPGVSSAGVNFMAQKMSIVFEDGTDPDAVMEQVVKNCRRVTRDGTIFL